MNIYFKNEDEINTFFDKKKKTLKIVNSNNPTLKEKKILKGILQVEEK